MIHTKREVELLNTLNSLVDKRITIKELNKLLSDAVDDTVMVYDVSTANLMNNYDDGLDAFNFMVNIEQGDLYAFIDIYMLPTRRIENEEVVYYITEVNCEFE